MSKLIIKTCIFLTVLFAFAGTGLALQSTTLRINVLDPNKGLIPNFDARLKIGDKVIKEIKNEGGQEAVFSEIDAGRYILEVEATGFKLQSQEVEIKSGRNELTVVLEIAEVVEEVKVESDNQEKSVDEGFNNFLTKEQINNLPEDPDELESELKRIAGGDNVVIRVDGFAGGRLPAKSQIASIRIVRSTYDAEYHEIGVTFVDITTKVGNSRFSGSLSFNFNDESLNARNTFSRVRFPEQSRNTLFFLDGPIVKDKTAFSIIISDNRDSTAQNIVAVLPLGRINDFVKSNFSSTYIDTSITHNLTKNIPIKLRYSFSNGIFNNLGVGGFNLAERAFSLKNRTHDLRFSQTGYVGNRFLNEFRFQYLNQTSQNIPQNENPTIVVLNSFTSGGAGNFTRSSKQSFFITDNLLFGIKQHALKIGGSVYYESQQQTSALNQNGTFIFPNLENFQLGRPSLYLQSPETRNAKISQWQIGAFIQDDIRISKSFILSLGVRYEWQNNLRDANNFSPRISFTWSPFKDGKTTFRGGIGLFYNFLETNNLITILSQNIDQPGETVIINPDYPNPFSNGTGEVLPRSYRQADENIKNPYVINGSFGVQNQISRTMQLRVEYTYQKGIHQFRSRDINAPFSGIRPNQDFGRIIQTESSAFFIRNALNATLSGRFTRNVSFGVNYNLSKIISDNDGIFGLPGDSYNLRADRSFAANDQRHRISGSIGWRIRKGLNFTTIFTANSALPYTITTGLDDNGDTNFNDRPLGVERNTERGTWRKQIDADLGYTFSFINRNGKGSNSSFAIVTTSDDSPGAFDFDPEKRFSIRLFVTAKNLLNNTNFTNFVGVETSPFYRQAISAERSRKIVFGMRFNF